MGGQKDAKASRSSALPSLFLAKLARISGYSSEAMWQLLLEIQSPTVMAMLLYCMRRAFEGIWRALGTLEDDRAPQLSAPQWQLLMPDHLEVKLLLNGERVKGCARERIRLRALRRG